MVEIFQFKSLPNTNHDQISVLNSHSCDQFQAGGGEIEWDKTTQGWILSAFFYGYLVTQVPSGILAGRFGGKRVMLAGVSLFGATTVLVPVAARLVN